MTTADIFMIVLTGIVAITGVVGVVIFNGQLTAMQKLNSDSRDAFITSNRAFVFLSKFDLNPIVAPNGNIVGWEVNPIFENTGPTPTKNMIIKINSQLNAVPPPNDDFPPDLPGPRNLGALIRPHATTTTQGIRDS